jgi:hypothetical protein
MGGPPKALDGISVMLSREKMELESWIPPMVKKDWIPITITKSIQNKPDGVIHMAIKEVLSKVGKRPLISLLLFNLIFWILFWIVFINASYPYQREPTGEFDKAIITYGSRSIMLQEKRAVHGFWTAALWLESPCFLLASFVARLVDPQFAGDKYFMGISESGWILLSAMCLSFLQWYCVGYLIQRFITRKSVSSLQGDSSA